MNDSLRSYAILWYDTVFTFPREVKSIWTRKPSLVSLVYITQRYPNLIVYAFLTASNSFPYPNDTVSSALYAELVSLIYI